MNDILLSIIIPCYNEEHRIKEGYDKLSCYLKNFTYPYEIIAVDDGSKDNTLSILKEIKKSNAKFKIVSYEGNKGKGGGSEKEYSFLLGK